MEVRDYLHVIRRYLWLVIVVPLIAVGLGVAYIVLQPARYTGTATVTLPPPAPGGSVSGATFQLVANFQGALASSTLIEDVAQETGAPAAVVAAIGSQQLGTSNIIELRLTWDDPEGVPRVLREAAREGLTRLRGSSLAAARAQLDQAEQDYEAVQEDIAAFLDETGLVFPPRQFAEETNRLIALGDQRNAAEAAGAEARAAELDRRIELRSETLRNQSLAWSTLQADRTRVLTARISADQQFRSVSAQTEAAAQASVVATTEPRRLGGTQYVAKRVVPIAVLALVLAVGLAILIETIRRPRREFARRTVGDEGQLVP